MTAENETPMTTPSEKPALPDGYETWIQYAATAMNTDIAARMNHELSALRARVAEAEKIIDATVRQLAERGEEASAARDRVAELEVDRDRLIVARDEAQCENYAETCRRESAEAEVARLTKILNASLMHLLPGIPATQRPRRSRHATAGGGRIAMRYSREELERRGWKALTSGNEPFEAWEHTTGIIVALDRAIEFEAMSDARVRAALEEAAKKADKWKECHSQIGPLFDAGVMQGATWIAEAIRALKPPEGDGGGG